MPQRLWRLVPAEHAYHAFSGQGAERFGWRWNRVGTPMVYLSETLSLAVLEIVVHLRPEDFQREYLSFSVDVPDSLKPIPAVSENLPEDWCSLPPGPASQNMGSAWSKAGTSVLLRVPSILIPGEYNFLLNPRHPDAKLLQRHTPRPFVLDPRLRRS